MKKYVIPVTELIRTETSNFVCGSGGREGQWGAGETGGDYANPDWDNEGGAGTGGTDPIEDDWGTIDSQGKAWGDLWDWD